MEENLYFAYGSNLDLEQMAQRCPDAGKAILSTDCCGSSRQTVNSLWIGMRGIPATTRKKP